MREYGWTQQRADSMLALVAMAWGSSYLLMKIGLDGIPPFCIIALRFGIAFIAVSLLFFKKFKKTTKRVMMKGAVLGLFLFGLFAFLMHGLQTTSASNGGFLTSTTVVLVPIFHAVIKKKMPDHQNVLSILSCRCSCVCGADSADGQVCTGRGRNAPWHLAAWICSAVWCHLHIYV